MAMHVGHTHSHNFDVNNNKKNDQLTAEASSPSSKPKLLEFRHRKHLPKGLLLVLFCSVFHLMYVVFNQLRSLGKT